MDSGFDYFGVLFVLELCYALALPIRNSFHFLWGLLPLALLLFARLLPLTGAFIVFKGRVRSRLLASPISHRRGKFTTFGKHSLRLTCLDFAQLLVGFRQSPIAQQDAFMQQFDTTMAGYACQLQALSASWAVAFTR